MYYMSMKRTRRLFTVNSWLGLITGIFLLLLGLSGAVPVFRHELDQLANRNVLTVKPTDQSLANPVSRCYQTIIERYPNLDGIAWLNPGAGQSEAYDFRLYLNDVQLFTYDLGLITFDPYTGVILRGGKLGRHR